MLETLFQVPRVEKLGLAFSWTGRAFPTVGKAPPRGARPRPRSRVGQRRRGRLERPPDWMQLSVTVREQRG